MRAFTLGVMCVAAVTGTVSAGEKADSPGAVLRAGFIANGNSMGSLSCSFVGSLVNPNDIPAEKALTDIAVSLAGKVAESLIDATAARTQPEVLTLDAVVPLDGFYGPGNRIAGNNDCLVFHNGTDSAATGATLAGVFRLKASSDGSAFGFRVEQWQFTQFLERRRSQWFQSNTRHDLVLKIEFLAPGTASLGTRTAFIEHVFPAVDRGTLPHLFTAGQQLPWFAAPPRPQKSDHTGRVLPLNVRVTLVQTSRPNQLGLWVRALANENRDALSAAVQESVRRSLDPAYEATARITQSETAAAAYAAYKVAWDVLKAHHDARPPRTDAAASTAWQAAFVLKQQVLASRETLARSAFSAASVSWPGNLPALEAG